MPGICRVGHIQVRIILAVAGAALVTATWLSVLRTVFMPSYRSSRTARWTARLTATVVFGVARRLSDGLRQRLLAVGSPVALFATAATWLITGLAGFALLGRGLADVPFGIRPLADFFLLRQAGVPSSASGVPLGAAALLSTALLIAAVIAYMGCLADAYSRRERLVIRLAAQATCPPNAETLIADHLRGGSRDRLGAMFGEWAGWLADTQATHLGYPVLAYYQSVDLCWPRAAVIVMDCAALAEACAPDWAPPETAPLLSAGSRCLQSIAGQLGIKLPQVPVSFHGREACPFDGTISSVRKAGLPMETDEDAAQAAFQRLRVQYAPFANAIVERLLCDPELR
jgi:hypothetical protein